MAERNLFHKNELICDKSFQMLNYGIKEYIDFNFDTQCQLDFCMIFVKIVSFLKVGDHDPFERVKWAFDGDCLRQSENTNIYTKIHSSSKIRAMK